jgi:hypothetical protein
LTRLQLLLVFLIGALAGTVFLAGCNDDDPGPIDPEKVEMVTVSGRVFDIDRAVPAVGVRIKLYGTKYEMDVPTGDDGAFLFQIPKGSEFIAHTDDFDTARDNWFPLINSEAPGRVVVDEDTSGLLVHACPTESAHPSGSVAAWLRQLGDCEDGTRKVAPDLSSPYDSGGILVFLVDNCEDSSTDTWGGYDNFRFTVDHPQMSAIGWAAIENDCPFDPSCGCILDPVNDGTTTASGLGFSFGAADFAGGDVEVLVEELDATRGTIVEDYTVPVAPGTITLTWWIPVDGDARAHWYEAICGCNAGFPVSCD